MKPVGDIPTPAFSYLTRQEKADAGIVVSASHNPYEHNGIKVFNGQDYKLSDEPMDFKTRGELSRRHDMKQLKRDYIGFVASTISSDLSGLRIPGGLRQRRRQRHGSGALWTV